MATFAADEDGILEGRAKAVMGKKTTSTTANLGSRAGDKTRATMASVQRVNSAFEYNDVTLEGLDDEDARSSNRRDQRLTRGLTKQANPRAQKRGPSATAPPAASSSSRRPAAKKQRTVARKTINQLPQVDLTAEDVVGNDGDDDEVQNEIVVRID